MKEKVAIIGGGFTGLSSALYLATHGYTPVVFESAKRCGGLATGFNPGNWRWDLEAFYHHVFTNDKDIIEMAKLVGCPVQVKKPVTNSFIHQKEVRLDSPLSLLRFSGMSIVSRLRMGVGLAILKIIPNGIFLEKYKVVDVLPKLLGSEGYKQIWEKLLKAKFGPYLNEVNLAWFWSRVAKRTKDLGYFEGGFGKLIEKIEEYVVKNGGEIRLDTKVESVMKLSDKGVVKVNGEKFAAVVVTIPAAKLSGILKGIEFPKINYLWGQTLILELSRKFTHGYWLNILEENFPFLVAVEQTNMIDKKYYAGKRIVYLGNYLPDGHKQLKMSKEQLIKLYMPYLKRINHLFKKNQIKGSHLFRQPFAQPVFPQNYSSKIPKMRTETPGVYLANMSMVYPFDRGTNYAVKMGTDVAKIVLRDLNTKK